VLRESGCRELTRRRKGSRIRAARRSLSPIWCLAGMWWSRWWA